MADLQSITFPEHLNRHTLTEQELSLLTPAQQALAKDWNVINRKTDWVIREVIEQRNIIVEHDRLLETFKKWLWLSTVMIGGGGGLGGVVYFIAKGSG